MAEQQKTNEKQLGRKPKETPSVEQGQFQDATDENNFKWLTEEYRNNDYDDTMVDALNSLPDDERNMMILFITHKNKLAPLARYFHVSTPFIRRKINEIREKMLTKYEELLQGYERTDYQLEKFRQKQAEEYESKKRTVVRMPLYEKQPITEYDSVEDAARVMDGNAQSIKNVCNGIYFKYLNYRWLWKEDYINKFDEKPKKGWYAQKYYSSHSS